LLVWTGLNGFAYLLGSLTRPKRGLDCFLVSGYQLIHVCPASYRRQPGLSDVRVTLNIRRWTSHMMMSTGLVML